MTALTIAQDIADEVGFPRPSTLVGSSDDQSRQLLAILNRCGYALVREFEWAANFRDKSVTVTSGTDTYALPTDYSSSINDSWWDTTNKWPMIGPLSTQEWETIKRGVIVARPRKRFRLVGEADGVYAAAATSKFVQIDPVPTNSTDTFYYAYVSDGFARQNSDAAASIFNHDSDNPILPEQLFTLGGIWRWKRAKGLDYGEERDQYERYLQTCKAQDGGARKLWLAQRASLPTQLITWQNIPEAGFGV